MMTILTCIHIYDIQIHECESCHLWAGNIMYEWFEAHVEAYCHTRTSRITHECVMSLIRTTAIGNDDAFIRVTWCHNLCICVAWLTHMCGMTHSHVWRDSFIRVIKLVHTWPIHTYHSLIYCIGDDDRERAFSSWYIVDTHTLIKRNPAPGGVSYLLCSLIKNRV